MYTCTYAHTRHVCYSVLKTATKPGTHTHTIHVQSSSNIFMYRYMHLLCAQLNHRNTRVDWMSLPSLSKKRFTGSQRQVRRPSTTSSQRRNTERYSSNKYSKREVDSKTFKGFKSSFFEDFPTSGHYSLRVYHKELTLPEYFPLTN